MTGMASSIFQAKKGNDQIEKKFNEIWVMLIEMSEKLGRDMLV